MGSFGFGNVYPDNWRNFIYGRGPVIYIILAIILALMLFALSRVPGKTKTYLAGPRESAWNACTLQAEQELGLPVAEAPAYSPPGVTLLSEDSYQVDVYDAQKDARYRCTVELTPEGEWQVRSLEVR